MNKNLVVLALVAVLSACATTSPMLEPKVAAAAAWSESATPAGSAVTPDWWKAFRSEELQALVDEALASSPELAIAMERVRQAEAQVRVAGASLFPALDAGYTARGSRTSGQGSDQGSNVSLTASYELDLWGQNSAGVRGAEASLKASSFDRDTAKLTLLAGVATAYFETLSLRGRVALARENLAIAERVLSVVQARTKNGAVSQLDLARQEQTVLSQRSALLALEQQERQTLAALAVLIGRAPEGFDLKAAGVAGMEVPSIDPGLPSELLLRRPDLASAEAQLAAANANVAAARAALLPRIQLTGSAGVASGALLAVVNGPTSVVSIAASILQPIFDGGRLKGQVTIAESRERELLQTYRKAILTAFADVEKALAAASRLTERETLQAQAQERAREGLRLAEVRYREGADDLLSVLDAQRTLFDAQDQLAQIRRDRLESAVALYKALGGGWTA